MSKNNNQQPWQKPQQPPGWRKSDRLSCYIVLLKMFVFNKNAEKWKDTNKYGPYSGENALNRNHPSEGRGRTALDLGSIDFKNSSKNQMSK